MTDPTVQSGKLTDEEITGAQVDGHTDYLEALRKDPNDNSTLGQEFVGRRIAEAQLAKAEPLIRADQKRIDKDEQHKAEFIWQQQIERARDGYVKLVEDQSLPKDPTNTGRDFINKQEKHAFDTGYFAMGQDMLKAGWRKVELD